MQVGMHAARLACHILTSLANMQHMFVQPIPAYCRYCHSAWFSFRQAMLAVICTRLCAILW